MFTLRVVVGLFTVVVPLSAAQKYEFFYPNQCQLELARRASVADSLRKELIPFMSQMELEGHRTNREIQAPLEAARAEIWKEFPHDPFARATQLAKAMKSIGKYRWNPVMEFDSRRRVMIDNGPSRDLRATAHLGMNTLIVQSANATTPQNANAILFGLHGVGASASHAERVVKRLRLFTSRRQSGLRGQLNEMLAENGLAVPRIYVEAPDLPFCGSGPNDPSFQSLDVVADWLAIRLRELRSPRKPIILSTTSSSILMALRLAERHPQLIDGFLIMSGNYPSLDVIRDVDGRMSRWHEETPNSPLNYQALLALSHWEYDSGFREYVKDPFSGKPRLLWMGSEDFQTPQSVRGRWEKLIGQSSVRYIEEGNHDLMPFLERSMPQTLDRFVEAYRLINQVIERHPK